MIPLPAPYLAALRSTFGWSATVAVGGEEVPVVGGTVTLDGSSALSRSVTLDLGGEDAGRAWARDVFAAIRDAGGRFSVGVAVTVPGLAPAAVPMGMYQAQTVKWGRDGSGLTVDALGRTSLAADDRFTSPTLLPPGPATNRIKALLRPTIDLNLPVLLGPGVTDATLPETVYDSDRLAAARDAALACGAGLYERGDGTIELRDLTGDVLPDLDAVVLDRAVEYDRQRVWNAVLARSSHEDYPGVWAMAQVNEGPLMWGGPFGRRTRLYSSPLLTTSNEAQAAAETLLARLTGRELGLSLSLAQTPVVEPGDVFDVVLDGVERRYVVDRVQVPLAVGGRVAVDTRLAPIPAEEG